MADNETTTAVAETTDQTEKKNLPMMRFGGGMTFQTLDEAWRFACYVSRSGLAPRGMEKPEAIIVAMQLGAEVGLSPMSSLQSIAVINGRPGIFGDTALGLVRASGLLEDYSEVFSGAGDEYGCTVTSKRQGVSLEISTRFTVADAKQANLWGKEGPWRQYPTRMLKWRARGFNLRDNFGDVLKGLRTTEELGDIIDITPAVPGLPTESPQGTKAAEVAARLAADVEAAKDRPPAVVATPGPSNETPEPATPPAQPKPATKRTTRAETPTTAAGTGSAGNARPAEPAATTPFDQQQPSPATGKPPAAKGPSQASLASMGHQPSPPKTVAAPGSSGLFDAAIAKSGVPVGVLNQYLVGTKYVRDGQGINEAPASIKAALVRDPVTFGRVVSMWVDAQQPAEPQPEPEEEQGQEPGAGDDQVQQ